MLSDVVSRRRRWQRSRRGRRLEPDETPYVTGAPGRLVHDALLSPRFAHDLNLPVELTYIGVRGLQQIKGRAPTGATRVVCDRYYATRWLEQEHFIPFVILQYAHRSPLQQDRFIAAREDVTIKRAEERG